MKIDNTNRVVEFTDYYGKCCSLHNSSLAGTAAIWLGPENDCMHLSVEQVSELLPFLENFVKTGYIGGDK